jgi:hypothetical protein
LNSGATSPNPFGAAIQVARGSGNANAAITWNETIRVWQITEYVNGSINTSNIATGTTTSGFISSVSQDPAPTLGGNLNILSNSIYSSVNGSQLFSTTQPGGGGTGLTVTNSQYTNVELINQTKSMIYSIIFG